MATGATLSTELPKIVDEIKEAAWAISAKTGVMKNLVTEYGKGKKGKSISVPNWDLTQGSARALTEGIAIGDPNKIANTYTNITPAESGEYYLITDQSIEDASDDVKSRASEILGVALGTKVEDQALAVADTFTTSYTASAFDLANVVRMRTMLEASKTTDPGNYNVVADSAMYEALINSMTNNPNYGTRGDVGNELVKKYLMTSILGNVDLYMSDITKDFTADTLKGAMFKKRALGMFVPRAYRLEAERDIKMRGWNLIATQRYGFGITADSLGLKFTAPNPLKTAISEQVTKVVVANTTTSPVNTKEVAAG